MSLIQNNTGFTRPKIPRKWKWYFFGGALILLVGSNILWQNTGMGQTERQLAYADAMNVPAQHTDSVLLLSFYEKLHAVYEQINTIGFDSLEKFNNVNVKTLPADFHTKLITYDLLDFAFDSLKQNEHRNADYQSTIGYDSFFGNVNATMGNGNFSHDFSTRKFHKGFSGDARYALDDRYIMVLVSFELVLPEVNDAGDAFESGEYSGGILVFDLNTLELVGYDKFLTTNSDEVMSGPMKKDYVNQTLRNDLEKNITYNVNYVSRSFFAMELWPVNHN